jgi:hypothetical protein
LGKRRRGDEDASSSDSEVPDDVKKIPMPRDTPPPIPKEILDQWYAKRRAKRNADRAPGTAEGEPEKPAAPVVESKTVYEAKPVVRDLRKEAVSAFVPTAVRMKIEKSKGRAGLLEPEEADRLERDGYLRTAEATSLQVKPKQMSEQEGGPHQVTLEEVEDEG